MKGGWLSALAIAAASCGGPLANGNSAESTPAPPPARAPAATAEPDAATPRPARQPTRDTRLHLERVPRTLHDEKTSFVRLTPDTRAQPPRTTGWFCFQYRRRPEAPAFSTECYRGQHTCQINLLYAVDMSPLARDFTWCRPTARAACFQLTDPAEQHSYPGCYEDLTECREMRASAKVRLAPYVSLGACEVRE